MAMEWSSTSGGSGNGMMILEQAKEELQILEAQHPNRFGYLKLELNSFIFLLESQNLINANSSNSSLPTSSTATTQVSSTSRKRKKCNYETERVMEGDIEAPKPKFERGDPDDRVDVAIDKAQACLYKIKQFKTNFCFINNTH